MILRRIVFGAAAAVLPLPAAAGAAGANAGDTAWIIAASALVLLMTLPGLATSIIVKAAGALIGGLRVDEEDEPVGLDLAAHGERGYDLQA